MTIVPLTERFVLLDGVRGVAAIAIVQRHAEVFFGRPEASSYLAVDLFFALSGFVLAYAYGQKLHSGQVQPLAFMKARFLRLYPLYVLSLALMAAFFITLFVKGLPTPIDDLHRNISPAELGFALLTGLLFLPAPFTLTLNGALFLVSPAWSLFNELVVNAFYARWGVRAQTRKILTIIAVSACVLVVAAFVSGKLHLGFRWHEMYAGMGRVFFSFFAGVLIYRFHSEELKLKPVIAALCLLFVCVVLVLPIPDDIRPFFDLFIVLLAWPMLLIIASRIKSGPILGSLSEFLGTASYGVYVLHIPLLAWTVFLMPGLVEDGMAVPAGIVFVMATTFVAWALTAYYDQPVQRWLKRRAKARRVIEKPLRP